MAISPGATGEICLMNFRYKKNDTCRMCGSSDLSLVLDLGEQPPSNAFIKTEDIPTEQSFPLRMFRCRSCGSSQLLDVVNAQDVFDDYHYLSSTSGALRNHFQGLVDGLLSDYSPKENSVIVDVGANDGIMLDRYPKDRYRLVGVEPSSAGQYAEQKGHIIVKDFFGLEVGRRIKEDYGPVALVTATNVCAHVDDMVDFMSGFAEMLDDDGLAVFECSYLPDMMEGVYFDTIYHEHLSYHGLTPLKALLRRVGLRAVKAERISFGASGPALRLTVALERSGRKEDASVQSMLDAEAAWGLMTDAPYDRFAENVESAIKELRETVARQKESGNRIGVFTAPAKGNTLLNSARFTCEDLEAVAENNALKCGKLTPGSHIPVISDEEFLGRKFDMALLLSWNYADFFVSNSDFVKQGGRFIVPLPRPVIRP